MDREFTHRLETMWMTGEEPMHTEEEIEAMEAEEYAKHKDDDKVGETILERMMGEDFKTFFTV